MVKPVVIHKSEASRPGKDYWVQDNLFFFKMGKNRIQYRHISQEPDINHANIIMVQQCLDLLPNRIRLQGDNPSDLMWILDRQTGDNRNIGNPKIGTNLYISTNSCPAGPIKAGQRENGFG